MSMTPEEKLEIKAQITRQTSELNAYCEAIEEANKCIAKLQPEVDAKQAEIDMLTAELREMSKPLVEAKSQIRAMQSNANALATAITGCRALLDAQK